MCFLGKDRIIEGSNPSVPKMAIFPLNNVVLEEEIDEEYEPSEEELLEYARWLGMSLPEDQDLLWIAREGLKAPMPSHWKPCRTEDDEIYYFNFESGDSVWEHPCDEYYRKLYVEVASRNSARYQHPKTFEPRVVNLDIFSNFASKSHPSLCPSSTSTRINDYLIFVNSSTTSDGCLSNGDLADRNMVDKNKAMVGGQLQIGQEVGGGCGGQLQKQNVGIERSQDFGGERGGRRTWSRLGCGCNPLEGRSTTKTNN